MHTITLTPAAPTIRVDVLLADGSTHVDSEWPTEQEAWDRRDLLLNAGFTCRVVGAACWGCGPDAGESEPVQVESQDACPACGSGRVVQQTPVVPGATGWGWRCRDCGHSWSLSDPDPTCPRCRQAPCPDGGEFCPTCEVAYQAELAERDAAWERLTDHYGESFARKL